MPVWLIALLFAIGASGFIYTKFIHKTGDSDPRQTAIVVGFVFALIFIFMFTILKFVLNFD